jgi:lactam utilization protein B
LLFWILVAGFLFVLYKNYKEEEKMSNNKNKSAVVKEETDFQDSQEYIELIKKETIKTVEEGNLKKTEELVKLWSKKEKQMEAAKSFKKKLKEKQIDNDEEKKTIGYRLGKSVGSLFSGFKEGINQKS